MKKWKRLNKTQKQAAIQKAVNRLLEDIIEGGIRFNDGANHDDLQARIDTAIAKADKMQTPWFANEYIMDTCKGEIESMARVDAEDAIYLEPHEIAVKGIL
jgi:hypothetical protein